LHKCGARSLGHRAGVHKCAGVYVADQLYGGARAPFGNSTAIARAVACEQLHIKWQLCWWSLFTSIDVWQLIVGSV
jgi:hypothetical protein